VGNTSVMHRTKTAAASFIRSHKVLTMFAVWLMIGIAFGCGCVGWSFLDALYYSVSAMTTGGMKSLPAGAPGWQSALTGVYAAIGVPIMSIAGGGIAHEISSLNERDRIEEQISSHLTEEEFVMMKFVGIEDDDGFIDRGEFIILILVRLGVLKPDVLRVIMARFTALDVKNEGFILHKDITNVYVGLAEGAGVAPLPQKEEEEEEEHQAA
jgi:hypothetical protein